MNVWLKQRDRQLIVVERPRLFAYLYRLFLYEWWLSPVRDKCIGFGNVNFAQTTVLQVYVAFSLLSSQKNCLDSQRNHTLTEKILPHRWIPDIGTPGWCGQCKCCRLPLQWTHSMKHAFTMGMILNTSLPTGIRSGSAQIPFAASHTRVQLVSITARLKCASSLPQLQKPSQSKTMILFLNNKILTKNNKQTYPFSLL